jgi:hypothetical protein
MVSGVGAWRTLVARDPHAAARAAAILRQHPDYERQWRPFIEASGQPHDELLFALAARWPDDVRGDPNYHRGAWHYVNLPLVPPGDTTRPPATPSGELLAVLPRTLATLGDSTTPDPQKAIALCWLLHLTGDIHQPLHAVTLFGPQWPEGDRGGNLFWLRPRLGARAVNLHSFWDDVVLPDRDAAPKPVATAAARLLAAFPRDALATEVTTLDPLAWAREESLPLARTAAYRDHALEGAASPADAPFVPSGYEAAARAVAERRLVLASYRIAEQLAATL